MRLRRPASRRARRRLPASQPAQPRDEPREELVRPSPAPSSPATRSNKPLSWLSRAGLFILSLAILASVVNMLSLSTDVKVVPLSATDGRLLVHPTAVYAAAANRQLNGSVWSRNKITINTASLSQALLKQFPELSSVNVTVPLLAHRPVVYIAATRPVLTLVTGNGSFVIDNTGRALIGNSGLNRPGLPLLHDQSGLRIQANRQALPATSVGFIQVVVAQLAAKQLAVADMSLPPAASELDVRLSGQPYFIKFNLEDDQPREQVGTFLATIAQLKRQNIAPAQYVDVRVPGRAYYK